MPKGIMYVETMPASPDREAEYHKWYNHTHLAQILSVEGIVSARRFAPNDGDGPCYSCLYNDEDEWLGDCQGNGVLAPVPGVIGTLMAEEALKLALGWRSSLRNRLLLWDAKRGDWQSVALKRDPGCVVCGRGT